MSDGVTPGETQTQDATRVGRNVIVVVLLSSHAGLIPAANAATQSGVTAMAMASSVTIATTAALTAEARGRVPFAEGAAGLLTANQERGGGAALQERGRAMCVVVIMERSFLFVDP